MVRQGFVLTVLQLFQPMFSFWALVQVLLLVSFTNAHRHTEPNSQFEPCRLCPIAWGAGSIDLFRTLFAEEEISVRPLWGDGGPIFEGCGRNETYCLLNISGENHKHSRVCIHFLNLPLRECSEAKRMRETINNSWLGERFCHTHGQAFRWKADDECRTRLAIIKESVPFWKSVLVQKRHDGFLPKLGNKPRRFCFGGFWTRKFLVLTS